MAFFEVFSRGFQGVSVDDIVKKTSMTKGAFYHHFPTKLDLGYALVDDVIKPMIIDRWIRPLDNYENPLEGILKQMKILIGKSDPAHLKRAKKAGYLKSDVNTRHVAHFVVMTHEGFYGMLKGLDDPKAFDAMFDSLKRYFGTITAE